MGLMILGYGVVAAAFYALITKTAKMEPEFTMAVAPAQPQATIIDITSRYETRDERKAA